MKAMSLTDRAATLAGIETVLRAAGAHAWTPEMIEAHKAAELAKAPPPNFLWHWESSIRKVTTWVLLNANGIIWSYFFGAVAIGSFALGVWWQSGIHAQVPSLTFGLLLVALAMDMAALAFHYIIVPLMWRVTELEIRPPAEWQETQWQPYFRKYPDRCKKIWKETLPAQAYAIIEAVLAIRPDANIVTHELTQGIYVLDPILEIDGHYVLVWDADGNTVLPH